VGIGAVDANEAGATTQVASANGGIGKFQNRAGETNTGIGGNAQLLRMTTPTTSETPVGVEFGLGTASGGATMNKSTLEIGGLANVMEGALRLGNQSHNMRIGSALGMGAAGRLHYGDADNDGLRELGFGVDAGPVSFDVKTELLHRAWNFLTGTKAKAPDGAAEGAADGAAQPQAAPELPPVAPVPAPAPVAPPPPARAFPHSPLANDDEVRERLNR
jgi:hypothetical protein